jgi:hypothetical protein
MVTGVPFQHCMPMKANRNGLRAAAMKSTAQLGQGHQQALWRRHPAVLLVYTITIFCLSILSPAEARAHCRVEICAPRPAAKLLAPVHWSYNIRSQVVSFLENRG